MFTFSPAIGCLCRVGLLRLRRTRGIRLEFEEAFYHVKARGSRRAAIKSERRISKGIGLLVKVRSKGVTARKETSTSPQNGILLFSPPFGKNPLLLRSTAFPTWRLGPKNVAGR